MLNAYSKVPAHQSISEISRMLAKGGAKAVMHEYDDAGNITALNFSMEFNGRPIGFRLPANRKGIHDILIEMRRKDTKMRRELASEAHALDVTWRVIKDWVEAQLAMIEANQAKIHQVFLPYAVTKDGKTLAEQIESDPSLLLGPGDTQ